MKIKKYKAIIKNTNRKVVGFLFPVRKYLGNGSYSPNEMDYCISVNSLSMPNAADYGTFLVEKESIEEFYPCGNCGINEQKKEFGYFACSQKCYDEL